MDPNNPNSNNPNDPNTPPSDQNTPAPPSGFAWPSTPGGGLSPGQPAPQAPEANTAVPSPTPDLNTPLTPDLQPAADFPPLPPSIPEPIASSTWPTTDQTLPPPITEPTNFGVAPLEQTPAASPASAAPSIDNLSPTTPPAGGLTPTSSGTIDGAASSGMPADLSQTPPQTPTESAPTDLSHLISENPIATNNHTDVYTPSVSQPENLVIPSNNVPESIQSSENHFNLSKLLIIVGVVIILVVSGLSAYFILGVGKPAPSPASVPTQDESSLTNPPQPIPTPTSEPTPIPASPSAAVSPTPTPKAGSAIDLLKQRQDSTSTVPTTPPLPPIPN